MHLLQTFAHLTKLLSDSNPGKGHWSRNGLAGSHLAATKSIGFAPPLTLQDFDATCLLRLLKNSANLSSPNCQEPKTRRLLPLHKISVVFLRCGDAVYQFWTMSTISFLRRIHKCFDATYISVLMLHK